MKSYVKNGIIYNEYLVDLEREAQMELQEQKMEAIRERKRKEYVLDENIISISHFLPTNFDTCRQQLREAYLSGKKIFRSKFSQYLFHTGFDMRIIKEKIIKMILMYILLTVMTFFCDKAGLMEFLVGCADTESDNLIAQLLMAPIYICKSPYTLNLIAALLTFFIPTRFFCSLFYLMMVLVYMSNCDAFWFITEYLDYFINVIIFMWCLCILDALRVISRRMHVHGDNAKFMSITTYFRLNRIMENNFFYSKELGAYIHRQDNGMATFVEEMWIEMQKFYNLLPGLKDTPEYKKEKAVFDKFEKRLHKAKWSMNSKTFDNCLKVYKEYKRTHQGYAQSKKV